MAQDEIRMKILADGVVSVDTDSFSETVHMEAEQIIKAVFDELGGESKVVEVKPHQHQHGHTHIAQTVKTR